MKYVAQAVICIEENQTVFGIALLKEGDELTVAIPTVVASLARQTNSSIPADAVQKAYIGLIDGGFRFVRSFRCKVFLSETADDELLRGFIKDELLTTMHYVEGDAAVEFAVSPQS